MTNTPWDERTKQSINGLQQPGWSAVFQMLWWGPSTVAA
jgi:hypothetical protein